MTQISASTLLAPVAEDMRAVDAVVRRRLSPEVMLISQIGEYIISTDDKRLRPVILLLVANALGYKDEHQHKLVIVIGFIHTATLLHDDVVDESDLRRDRKTASAVFDNAASVLVGDFLHLCVFQMMVQANSMHIVQILADATNIISEGKVLQLLNIYDPGVTEERYLQVIHYKTAKLFEAAAQIGVMLSGAGAATEEAAAEYGHRIGAAFQIVNDLPDYTSTVDQMGKNAGDDLREGRPTLPLIHLLSNDIEEQRALVCRAIEQGGMEHFDTVFAATQAFGVLEYTRQTAECETAAAETAVSTLSPSLFHQVPIGLRTFSLQRQFWHTRDL